MVEGKYGIKSGKGKKDFHLLPGEDR